MSRKLKPKTKLAGPRKQTPKWKREKSISLYLWIIIPIIVALAIGLVGYWGYNNYVSAWQQPVVKINDTVLDMGYYVKMLRIYSYSSRIPVTDANFPGQVLNAMVENELIKQGAEKLNLNVSSDQITTAINSSLLTEGEVQGNITVPESELDKRYKQRLDIIEFSDSEYRDFVETVLLSQVIREYLKENVVPKETEQVHLHLIVLDDEETAGNVTNLLNEGREFGNVSAEYSVLEDIREEEGDMGWVPRGVYPELDDIIFELGAGNITGPVQSGDGYFFAMVSEEEESMPVPESYMDTLAINEFEKWLQEQEASGIIETYLDEDKISWAVEQAQ